MSVESNRRRDMIDHIINRQGSCIEEWDCTDCIMKPLCFNSELSFIGTIKRYDYAIKIKNNNYDIDSVIFDEVL